jgi:3-hydroxyacyl-[acyl-carrier-protein] dehydratase
VSDESKSQLRMPMLTQDIERCIPHRHPFLLIDRILDCRVGEYILATRNVSSSDVLLQGHFPGNPIMPGVLIIEGMAQASAVLGKLTDAEACNTCLLTEIGQTRFRRKVIPGDVLEYHIKVVKRRRPFFWFEGEAKVAGEIAAMAHFSAKLV